MVVLGADLSHWDGTVEWPLVPQDIKFVFIKATEGGYIPDHLADQHYVGAQGRLRGLYHFWRYGCGASTQTNEFINRIKALEAVGGDMELPPVLDLEDCRAPKSSVIVPHIKACLQMLENFDGRKPIIYTSRWWSEPWLGDCSWLRDYPLWVASYTYNPSGQPLAYSMPRGLTSWKFWQYSDKGAIPGIAENNEDLDVFNGTEQELYMFAGMTPPPTLEQRVDKLETWAKAQGYQP